MASPRHGSSSASAARTTISGRATRILVGFPGETDAEFAQLLDFVEEQRFDHVGAFTYSPQPGTPAAEHDSAVPHELAAERYGALMELAQSISLERNRELVGREIEVLVESAEPTTNAAGDPVVVGRSYRDAPEVDGLAFLRGEFAAGAFVRARVDGAMPYDLLCSPVAAPIEA